MVDEQRPPADLPGWPAVHDRSELEAHDPFDPAWLLIPAALVRPVFLWIELLTRPDPLGALARAVEGLLVAFLEPDTRGMVSSWRLIGKRLGEILERAGEEIPDEEIIPMGDEEEDS